MSRNSCCVAMCKNVSKNTKGLPGQRISYYTFPRDENLKQKWIRQCRRADSFRTDHARICSIHFADNQFQNDLQAKLMGYDRPRKLKKGAIPTLFLKKIKTEKNQVLNQIKDVSKEFVEEYYDKLDLKEESEENCDKYHIILNENKNLKKENKLLKVQVQKLEEELKKFKNS